ncbi:hypothetical protein ABIE65_005259 [Constrictibacter sp. MBR-5]|uniref:hypothetical protein n=1 Tax=Constrictibacter sp. MBR-5 TaxID=3156467 RepID=UPI0033911D7B
MILLGFGFEACALKRDDQGVRVVGEGSGDDAALKLPPGVRLVLEGAETVELLIKDVPARFEQANSMHEERSELFYVDPRRSASMKGSAGARTPIWSTPFSIW